MRGKPTILRLSRRRCSSAWPRKARHSLRWARARKRRDGDCRQSFSSPPPCGEGLGVGVHTGGADVATPLPDLPPQGGRERKRLAHLTIGRTLTAGRAPMTHPGEKFYPEGVHWDDPIAQGTLPDLLSKAALQYGARPAIEFRDRPISYAELEAMVEVAASAFLRGGYGKHHSVAPFLGDSRG